MQNIKQNRGSAVVLLVVIVSAIVVTGVAAINSSINESSRTLARTRAIYSANFAIESLVSYVQTAADRAYSCQQAGSAIVCPGPVGNPAACSAAGAYGPSYTTLWGTGAAPQLFCFSKVAGGGCGAGGLGVEYLDYTGTVKTACLSNVSGSATLNTMYVKLDGTTRKFFEDSKIKNTELMDIDQSRLAKADQILEILQAGFESLLPKAVACTGSYCSLTNKASIPLSKAGSAVNASSSPGLNSTTPPPSAAAACPAGNISNQAGEICQQQCTVAKPCLQVAVCIAGPCLTAPAPTPDQLVITRLRVL